MLTATALQTEAQWCLRFEFPGPRHWFVPTIIQEVGCVNDWPVIYEMQLLKFTQGSTARQSLRDGCGEGGNAGDVLFLGAHRRSESSLEKQM